MHDKEKAIIEQRTLQATKNNLLGASGKLGTIARYLGSPILKEGYGLYSQTYLEDPFEVKEEIPTAEDIMINCEGYVFDGLSRGMHIEIIYIESTSKLTVNYKGYPVYVEVAGDLLAYAPFENKEWENMVSRLYEQALNKQKKKKETDHEIMVEKAKEKQKSFLERLRLVWGL